MVGEGMGYGQMGVDGNQRAAVAFERQHSRPNGEVRQHEPRPDEVAETVGERPRRVEQGAEQDTALALARIWVSEAFGVGPDNAAILSVLRGRANAMNVDLMTAMRRYCPRSFDKSRTDQRRWIAHLDIAGNEPVGWPRHLRWERYRPRWMAMQSEAQRLLGLGRQDNCSEYPQHWSARSFRRPFDLGWRLLDCPGTSNHFWIRTVR